MLPRGKKSDADDDDADDDDADDGWMDGWMSGRKAFKIPNVG